MKFLFIHQNFPGQFRHVAKALVERGHQVMGLGDAENLKQRPVLHPNLPVLAYPKPQGAQASTHHYVRDLEGAVRRGQQVVRACRHLTARGFRPDVVFAHSGWGETLFLRDVFPDAKIIHYCEYYFHGKGGDVGFDPEFPATMDDELRIRIRNANQLVGLVQMDAGIAPTQWQASRYPETFRDKIRVIHEGIDTDRVRPDDRAVFRHGDLTLKHDDEVITYVARNLEPYRGFHIFMRALPALLKARPQAHVVVVGGDEVSYGRRLPEGQTYRQRALAALGDALDHSRVHFVGKLPYPDYLKVLQISSAHVYLTYPFVLSWSLLEAMAAGCLIVASRTAPVEEVVADGENGLLVNFHDAEALAKRVVEALHHPASSRLRTAARATVVDRYDLERRCLPEMLAWLETGCREVREGR